MIRYLHFNHSFSPRTGSRFKKRFQNRTVAAQALQPDEVRLAALSFVNYAPGPGEGMLLDMKVGVTKLHPKDQYTKSIGRTAAVAAMKNVKLEILEIESNKTHIYISLAPHEGVKLTLRLNKTTGYSTVQGVLEG